MKKIIFAIIIGLLICPMLHAETMIEGKESAELEIVEFGGIAAPGVSPSNKARMYFDSSANVIKYSENGGAYGTLGGGTAVMEETGGIVQPITQASDLSVGGSTFVAGSIGIGNTSPSFGIEVTGTAYISSSLEIPNGTDPDVDAAGEISFDSDDNSIRGFDGTNQVVLGKKESSIFRCITKPNSLDEADTLDMWHNYTGFDFVITAIHSRSDTDDVDYLLKETDGTDYSSLTTIETDLSITGNGTNVFYSSVTDIDNPTIENGNSIVFDNDGTDDPDSLSFTIVGYLNADVD